MARLWLLAVAITAALLLIAHFGGKVFKSRWFAGGSGLERQLRALLELLFFWAHSHS